MSNDSLTAKIPRRLNRIEKTLSWRHQQLRQTRNQRLSVGLLLLALTPFMSHSDWFQLALGPWLVALTLFVYLVTKSKKLNSHIEDLDQLKKFYQRQHLRWLGKYKDNNFAQFITKPELRSVISDLHLFGPTSLFSLLDETITYGGQSRLKDSILNTKKTKNDILDQQSLIQEIVPLQSLMQRLRVRFAETIKIDRIDLFLQKPTVEANFSKLFPLHLLFWSIATVATIALFIAAQYKLMLIPLLGYGVFSLSTQSAIQHAFSRAQDFSWHINELLRFIRRLEILAQQPALQSQFNVLRNNPVSKSLEQIELYISFLSVQGHPLVAIIINGLLPWNFVFSHLVEKWRVKFKNNWPTVSDEIYEFEKNWSLTNFYYYQTQTFPKISNSISLSAKNISHPLIDKKVRITNSFNSENIPLHIISGSNMSGKSTFLRTLGINHLLANCGAPVFADEMSTFCGQALSCITSSDSLTQGYSTFYYEVRRVSEILKAAQSQLPTLFLIDEIFSGTNHHERVAGSRCVIDALCQSKHVLGFITTHDLELTHLEKYQSPQNLNNWHFRDEVIDQKLHFNFTIHPGPCPTTNALKIMALEGLPIPHNSHK